MDFRDILKKTNTVVERASKGAEDSGAASVRKHVQDAPLRPGTSLANLPNPQMDGIGGSSLSLRNTPHFDATTSIADLHGNAFNDPVAKALRHFEAVDVSVLAQTNSDIPHVSPNSIQSSQSPAAYLKYIYKLAQNEISQKIEKYKLDQRRPDLKNLVLSEDNLHQQISTLSLVNELLEAQLVGEDPKPFKDHTALVTHMRMNKKPPFSTPFDGDQAIVREALLAMNDLNLNRLACRARPDNFALTDSNFSLVPNYLNGLKLYDGHSQLFKKTSLADDDLYGGLYGLRTPKQGNKNLQDSKKFMDATGLDFADLRALVGDDVNVYDEDGQADASAYIEFLAGGHELKLAHSADNKTYTIKAKRPNSDEWTDVPEAVHELQNKAIRLQQRTGLPYYQLDGLLRSAMWLHRLTTDGSAYNGILEDGSALTVLAHFKEWRSRYDLTVDQYTALLCEINYFHREGSDEPTLMRHIFGDDAAEITRHIRKSQLQITRFDVIEGEGPEGHLGGILRRGLRLSSTEWIALLKVLEIGDSSSLDGPTLGRIYRLTTLFSLFNWGVLNGLGLLYVVDAHLPDSGLLEGVTTSAPSTGLLSVIDRLSWLASWMKEAGLSAEQVIQIINPPTRVPLRPTQDILNWVKEVKITIQNARLVRADFLPYEQWPNVAEAKALPITISPDDWINMLSKESGAVKQIINQSGLILPVTSDEVETAVRHVLIHYKVLSEVSMPDDPSAEGCSDVAIDSSDTEQRLAALVGLLLSKQAQQADVLSSEIVQLSDQVTSDAVPALLAWMKQDAYSVLDILDAWDTDKQAIYQPGLILYADLVRHIAVVEGLQLNTVDLIFFATQPSWVSSDKQTGLSLKQIYLLSRFKTLQNSHISADAWMCYFIKANEASEADQTENYEFLSVLLDWPAADIAELAESKHITGKCIINLEQADFIARRIRLCRDMNVGAQELIKLEKAACIQPNKTDDQKNAIWAAAADAARTGLHNFQQGIAEVTARGTVDEETRNALVGLYMRLVAAKHTTLKNFIKTDENLYEYLLLDVKVSHLVPTSRLLAATGAVQLYINRAVENLSPSSSVHEPKKLFLSTWDIARQYRLWEANEKLKCFPSNYIEPELRQTKSQLFDDFEMALGQGSLDEDSVEKAINGYVGGLQRQSDMRSLGFFCNLETKDLTTYYFTAKAKGEQHGYYIRRLDVDHKRIKKQPRHALKWHPWTTLGVPVAARYAYGITPAYAWGRLFIFWFELEERRSKDGKSTRYYLKPKYCRQNLDGSFSEPWEPNLSMEAELGMELKVGEGEPFDPEHPERLDLTVDQPKYTQNILKIELGFQSPALKTSEGFYWFTKQGSSDVIMGDLELPYLIEMDGYRVDASLDLRESSYSKKRSFSRNHILDLNDRVSVYDCLGSEVKVKIGVEKFQWIVSSKEKDEFTVKFKYKNLTWKIVKNESKPIKFKEAYFTINNPESHFQPTKTNLSMGGQSLKEVTLSLKCSNYADISVVFRFEIDDTGQPLSFKFLYNSVTNIKRDLAHSYVLLRKNNNRLFENYLLTHPFKNPREWLAIPLFSTGIQQIVQDVVPGGNLDKLFTLENQEKKEQEAGVFLKNAQKEIYGSYGAIQEPFPQEYLDFYGPYGQYAWELFFHIPLMIAAKYNQAGNHQAARVWLHKIYDPREKDDNVWRVRPLKEDAQQISVSAITDPDQIATENPSYYRLVVMRHYLRTMIDQGDALYRMETLESLREAKMWYVTAKNLFNTTLMADSDMSTRATWATPTLEKAEPDQYDPKTSFRPPYNVDLRDAYSSLEQRLDNLRHWRSIDGEPLSIALLAPPIDPRELQTFAMANSASNSPLDEAQVEKHFFTFESMIVKAQSAVENLMYFGDLLNEGIWRKDAQVIDAYKATNALKIAESIGRSSIESEINALESKLDQLDIRIIMFGKKNLFFAVRKIISSTYMYKKHAIFAKELVGNTFISATQPTTAALRSMPNIFGTSNGGADFAALADLPSIEIKRQLQNLKFYGNLLDKQESYFLHALNLNEQLIDFTTDSLILEDERKQLHNRIQKRKSDLDEFDNQILREQELVDLHRRRSTNQQFNNWYVGRAKALYDMAYQICLRYCRLAEQAYIHDSGNGQAHFINPIFDTSHSGLLSGQSLMLDLQRMELAFLESRPKMAHRLTVKLSELLAAADTKRTDETLELFDPSVPDNKIGLEDEQKNELKLQGYLFFKIPESLFDNLYPDEYDRRLKSVCIKLEGVQKQANVGGRLSLLGHRSPKPQGASTIDKNRPYNAFNPQHIPLSGTSVDTSTMTSNSGRLLPFERCGVDSHWMLSFPSIVNLSNSDTPKNQHQVNIIKTLEDVELEITYTARV